MYVKIQAEFDGQRKLLIPSGYRDKTLNVVVNGRVATEAIDYDVSGMYIIFKELSALRVSDHIIIEEL